MCGVDLKEGGDEGSGEINGYNRKQRQDTLLELSAKF